MFTPRRRRRGTYHVAHERSPFLVRLAGIALVLLLIFLLVPKVLRGFGFGNIVHQAAAILRTEEGGSVRVSLEGKDFQRAEQGLRLYAGDSVQTGNRSHALLTFFDGTHVRLDEETQLGMSTNVFGSEKSEISLTLQHGGMWVAIPSSETFTGSIVRTVHTPRFVVTLPPRTEALVSADSLIVFEAAGLGTEVTVQGYDTPLRIGEGQQLSLPPSDELPDDPYTLRSPLDPVAIQSTFTLESRRTYAALTSSKDPVALPPPEEEADLITLVSPPDDLLLEGATVEVRGEAGKGVARVRVNGYLANLDTESRTFRQELSVPEDAEFSILVEALDDTGVVLAQAQRTVRRDIQPPLSPVITQPAQSGQTYRTQMQELEIRGKAPEDAVGIVVNGYRLQLFGPGDTEWSYLASVKLGNLEFGENTFEVTSIDPSGNTSEPAVLTIVLGAGEEGVIERIQEGKGEEEEKKVSSRTGLSENDPLEPGTITVTSPTPGESHEADSDEFSIRGATSPSTYSIWVNDYRLRLYEPGSVHWKYIASHAMGTLKRGLNTYEIITRNIRGEILDRKTYTVRYRVR